MDPIQKAERLLRQALKLIESAKKPEPPKVNGTKTFSDSAIELVREFQLRFPHYRNGDSKQTKRELQAATALLQSASANEILDLAAKTLADSFAGTKRKGATLTLIQQHYSELRALFPDKPQIEVNRDWAGEKTLEEQWTEWDQYVESCEHDGREPDISWKPTQPKP